MEDEDSSHSHSSTSPQRYTSNVDIRSHVTEHVTGGGGDAAGSTAGAGGGARYKLMSPAKLPISRSACITIPPGLSPTSFLESPVLLTNIKAEPSPTTGSFFKPKLMQGSIGSATFSLNADCSTSKPLDDSKSIFFEFKPNIKPTLVPGFSSTRLQVSAGFNLQEIEPSGQNHSQSECQSYPSSSLANCEVASPKEQTLAAPVYMIAPMVSALHEETNGQEKPKSGPSVDRSLEDGYNWRKYGQKVVKGSEFPRSYYKCTHPNCEVKKIFERSYTGQITEIVYKGTHDHPKPQPSRRFTAGALMSIQEENAKVSSLPGQAGLSGTSGQSPNFETSETPVPSPIRANDDSMDGAMPQLNSTNDEVDEDDPYSKRRRTDVGTLDITPVVKPIREPRVVVQTISEVDILDDGYRWRKYGQKVVRGNPNPRSYYKCTSVGCPVRKHVERASHDPKAVITTYEGKHNHEVPTAKSNSHDANGNSRIRSQENDAICLDLVVGNRISDQPQPLNGQSQNQSQTIHSQHDPSSNFNKAVHSFDITTLTHSSSPYSQNLGRMLMGP